MIFHAAKIHIILFSAQKNCPAATHFFSPNRYGPPSESLRQSGVVAASFLRRIYCHPYGVPSAFLP